MLLMLNPTSSTEAGVMGWHSQRKVPGSWTARPQLRLAHRTLHLLLSLVSNLSVVPPQAKEAARKLGAQAMAALPGPGEVEFLCGGPPCQGYSGMNRFNKGELPPLQVSVAG